MLRSVSILTASQVLALGLWFSAASVVVSLSQETGIPVEGLASLTTATQIGFVLGALGLALSGLPDRLEPRRLFAVSVVIAAIANLGLLVMAADSWGAIASRALVGAALAGCYPVGLKIAVGWSLKRRGLITSLLVGALTLGSAMPHLVGALGGTDWRATLWATSALACLSAIGMLQIGLGPHHQPSAKFEFGVLRVAFRTPGVRRAYLGYFGHMWELYGFWAWVGTATTAAAITAGASDPRAIGSAVAFAAIAIGGLACIPSGWLADRIGKAQVARLAMIASASCAVLAAAVYSGPLPILILVLLLWGIAVIPDSPQFSALVADAAPPSQAGSLLTLQTAIGFGLTTITVQGLPYVAEAWGWSAAFLVLALGPVAGIVGLGWSPQKERAPAPASHPDG